MKHLFCFALLLLAMSLSASCTQDSLPPQGISYHRIWIKNKEGKTYKGYFAGFSDSSVFRRQYLFRTKPHHQFDEFVVKDIAKISTRKSGNPTLGFFLGGLGGVAAGLLLAKVLIDVGCPTGSSRGCVSVPAIAALFLTPVVGIGVGLTLGFQKKKIYDLGGYRNWPTAKEKLDEIPLKKYQPKN